MTFAGANEVAVGVGPGAASEAFAFMTCAYTKALPKIASPSTNKINAIPSFACAVIDLMASSSVPIPVACVTLAH